MVSTSPPSEKASFAPLLVSNFSGPEAKIHRWLALDGHIEAPNPAAEAYCFFVVENVGVLVIGELLRLNVEAAGFDGHAFDWLGSLGGAGALLRLGVCALDCRQGRDGGQAQHDEFHDNPQKVIEKIA